MKQGPDGIECVGGPYDGKRMPDRGFMWRVADRPAPRKPEEPWAPPPAPMPAGVPPGTYILIKGFYHWRPSK